MEAYCKAVHRAGASPPSYLLLQKREQAASDMLSLQNTCCVPQTAILLESLQAINHDKSDLDAKWDKAVLHDTIGEPRKASDASWN